MDASAANGGDDALYIMDNILAAETEEELFARQEAGATAGRDFVNRPFRLLPENVTWKKSNDGFIKQGGFPFWALLRVLDMETDEYVVIDCGGKSVVAVLDKLLQFDDESRPLQSRSFERFRAEGGRPLQFVAKPVSSGQAVLLLKPVATGTATRDKVQA
jgi:hypothetical protein